VRTEAEAVTVLGLPVLAMVPSLTIAAERLRARRRRRFTLSAGAVTSVVAVTAVTLWVLLG
jgi:hypothetical protein